MDINQLPPKDEEFVENVKFPHWKGVNATLIRISNDIGAHAYFRQIDPDCPFVLSDHTPVLMFIPYQWFTVVPVEDQQLFTLLYNEFADALVFDANLRPIIEKFTGILESPQVMRYEFRRAIFEALMEYQKHLQESWDGNFEHPRSIRDRFLNKLCCEDRPLPSKHKISSEYVKEGDKIWLV